MKKGHETNDDDDDADDEVTAVFTVANMIMNVW